MKDLRVYQELKGVDPQGASHIFYSQRAGGPYYRWRYEELREEWRCSRMHPAEAAVTEFVSAPWKDIPAALKVTLDQHYVE